MDTKYKIAQRKILQQWIELLANFHQLLYLQPMKMHLMNMDYQIWIIHQILKQTLQLNLMVMGCFVLI